MCLHLESPVEDIHLRIVAKLGCDRSLSIATALLRITIVEVNDHISHAQTNFEKLLALLEAWRRKDGDEATVNRLLKVCEEVQIAGSVEKEMKLQGCMPDKTA